MLLRIKDLLAQMADEVALPVSGNFERVPASALSRGARELAFACAYLVMDQDLTLVGEERVLANKLAVELGLDRCARAGADHDDRAARPLGELSGIWRFSS